MNFIVRCTKQPDHPDHNDFWTTVPMTTYWSVIDGKMSHSGTGKLWNPHEKDEYFCQECGELAEVIENGTD